MTITHLQAKISVKGDRPYAVLRWRRWLKQANYISDGDTNSGRKDAPSLPTRSAIVMLNTGKKRGMCSALCCPPLAEVPKAEVVKASKYIAGEDTNNGRGLKPPLNPLLENKEGNMTLYDGRSLITQQPNNIHQPPPTKPCECRIAGQSSCISRAMRAGKGHWLVT